MAERTVYYGTFIHSKSLSELEYLEKAVGVDENGKIAFMVNSGEQVPEDWKDAKEVRARSNQFFFPGFIDTHIHASQYPNTGLFGKTTLLDWLNKYTFPTESSFKSIEKARAVYTRCVRRTLSHGTTTAAYYATIHLDATNLLAQICKDIGQRAFIGRVCMDCLGPDYYKDESAEQGMKDTLANIDYIRKMDPTFDLITPILTPRFAPSCSRESMKALGELAKEQDLPIQTHISENTNEIELVKQLFPESKNYTDVYDTHGLLTSRTILAHCVHISEEELQVIKDRDAKISHCPASNTMLTSGFARVRRMLDKGVDVGLGTDVSGGHSPSILDSARQALGVSRSVSYVESSEEAKLSVEEGLYLATRGGAKVVGLEDRIGGFEVGKDWDAQLVGIGYVEDGNVDMLDAAWGTVDIFPQTTFWIDKVAKWLFTGDDRNTLKVWVKGKLVHEKTSRLTQN